MKPTFTLSDVMAALTPIACVVAAVLVVVTVVHFVVKFW